MSDLDPVDPDDDAGNDDVVDVGQSQVQSAKDVEDAKGFAGVKVDPTPNEHYTFPGQAAGLPTPETHDDQAAEAAEHARKVARGEVTA